MRHCPMFGSQQRQKMSPIGDLSPDLVTVGAPCALLDDDGASEADAIRLHQLHNKSRSAPRPPLTAAPDGSHCRQSLFFKTTVTNYRGRNQRFRLGGSIKWRLQIQYNIAVTVA